MADNQTRSETCRTDSRLDVAETRRSVEEMIKHGRHASLYAAAHRALDEVDRLRAALEQYADPINWATTHINTPAQVQTVRACWIGGGKTGGDIAREALR